MLRTRTQTFYILAVYERYGIWRSKAIWCLIGTGAIEHTLAKILFERETVYSNLTLNCCFLLYPKKLKWRLKFDKIRLKTVPAASFHSISHNFKCWIILKASISVILLSENRWNYVVLCRPTFWHSLLRSVGHLIFINIFNIKYLIFTFDVAQERYGDIAIVNAML